MPMCGRFVLTPERREELSATLAEIYVRLYGEEAATLFNRAEQLARRLVFDIQRQDCERWAARSPLHAVDPD